MRKSEKSDIIKAIRVTNINRLAEKHGRQRLVACDPKWTDNYINQLCGGFGSFGPAAAAKIEESLNLEPGWLSQRHELDSKTQRMIDLMAMLPPEKQDEIIANAEFHAQRALQLKAEAPDAAHQKESTKQQ